MRRAIAIIGLITLASQIALGSAGSVFLCLCKGDLAHETPCRPTKVEAEVASCHHDEAQSLEHDTHEDDECADVLIKGLDIDSLDRLGDIVLIKAPLAAHDLILELCPKIAANSAASIISSRASPLFQSSASAQYSRTIRQLI
jgi:hypothetical protein